MKKSSYILGIISISIILIATIFKAMHFPGAGILLTLGISFISLVFLPVAYLQLLKSTDDKVLKWVYHAAFISFFIDFVGMLFKIMHWPGASKLMIIGVPIPFILFLPVYIYYHNKRKLKTDIYFFGVILFMIYLGVFSSLLAVNYSYDFLHGYAKTTEMLDTGNSSLKELKSTSEDCEKLVNGIELIKVNIALQIAEENAICIRDGKLFDYEHLFGKDKHFENWHSLDSEVKVFGDLFDDFKQNTPKNGTNELIQQLFKEIDYDRLPSEPNTLPAIAKLNVIYTLNILTDWQNKILLIDYLSNSKKK